jgi:hypothetical protein
MAARVITDPEFCGYGPGISSSRQPVASDRAFGRIAGEVLTPEFMFAYS